MSAPTTDTRADAPVHPGGVEHDLARVLAGVLGVDEVGPDGHFFDDLGADSMLMARFCARVRKRPDLPSVSIKDVYRHPTVRRLATALAPAGPGADVLAAAFAEVLGGVLGAATVATDGHFFDDLGADSMLMARFCARVRKRPDLPSVSMQDVYRHPTVDALAAALGAGPAAPPAVAPPEPARAPPPRCGTPAYVLCGLLQLLAFVGYSSVAALITTRSYRWITAGAGALDVYQRAVVAGGLSFLGVCALPVVVKWVLIGRWKAREIRIWSLGYVRFWVVKTLVRADPLVLFAGSPLYVLYLRALGARIGRGAVVLARSAPVCTDLLTIGAGAVVLPDALISCYRAHGGVIQTGPVRIGRDALVAEASVVDIGAVVGNAAQLGRSSSLHAGQVVPDGQRWHGSPARRTDADYREVRHASCGTARRVLYTVRQLALLVGLYLPLVFGGTAMLATGIPSLAVLLGAGAVPAATTWTFYRDALVVASVLFFGAVLLGLLVVTTVPRLLHRALVPDRIYRLYGFHYSVFRTIMRLTNVRLFTRIFGDSSYVVGYLRRLGWRLGWVLQSGSNFGTEVRQHDPFLCRVGSGTMVADGLSMLNGGFSSTSFRVSRVTIGARNFLGNRVVYPARGRTGENCLLATKVLVPIDGAPREGVGLLGSPSFEIPRSVERDGRFDRMKRAGELRRRLAAKNRHNLATIALFLLTRWLYVVGLAVQTGLLLHFYDRFGAGAVAADIVATPLFTAVYFVLVERAVTASDALRPLYCSIYERDFWGRERYWKVPAEAYLQVFNGTPVKNVVHRLLGVRVGRRVFDDGCFFTERALVTVGDDATLNAASVVQCHSQEDGTFKSDRTALGDRVTVGVGAFVHYGVTLADGAVLAPDSFLMKGEAVPAGAHWGGNPAVELRAALVNRDGGRAR